MFLQNLQWRYLKLSIFLSKWNSFIAMHRSLNKPLFLTTDISSAQRKGSQQKRRHHHTILAQNQWCACELPWRPQKLHPEDTSEVHKSQQTTQLLTTRQTDLSFEKVNPLSKPRTWQDPHKRAACSPAGLPFSVPSWDLAPSERDWSLVRCRALWKMGKRYWSPKNHAFLLIN